MAGKQGVLFLATTLVVLSAVFGVSSATTVNVGGSTGWTIPSSPSFYTQWASQQKLQVGDKLVFTFPTGAHTVAQVSKADYDACTSTSTVGPVLSTAPASVTLTSAGTHYFICTVNGHCSANQKLAVTVASSTAAPKASPAPKMAPKMSPSPMTAPVPAAETPSATAMPPMPAGGLAPGSSATSPSEAGGSTPPPAGNSAAATGVTLLSLLSIVAAFLVC